METLFNACVGFRQCYYSMLSGRRFRSTPSLSGSCKEPYVYQWIAVVDRNALRKLEDTADSVFAYISSWTISTPRVETATDVAETHFLFMPRQG